MKLSSTPSTTPFTIGVVPRIVTGISAVFTSLQAASAGDPPNATAAAVIAARTRPPMAAR